jgi:hypothetical protein
LIDNEKDRRNAMAVGLIFDGSDVTQAQYEQVFNEVVPDGQAPAGLVYHAGGLSENGVCVIEVWESQEVLDRFFQDKLGRALQNAKIDVQPRTFQVVKTLTP